MKLFHALDVVLDVSLKKFSVNSKRDLTRLKWGRLIVQASSTYGSLLNTEELEQRIEQLEETVKHGVVIPDEKHHA